MTRENALLESVFTEHGLAGVVEAFSFITGSLMVTRGGVITAVDEDLCYLSGYDEDSLLGMSADELILKHQHPTPLERLAQARSKSHLCQLRRRDGEVRRVFISTTDFSAGEDTYCISELVDFSEHLAAHRKLASREQMYNCVFEQAAVGIARVAPNGEWLECNERLCDIIGYDKDELLQTSFQALTHPDDLDKDLNFVEETLAGLRNSYSIEKRYVRKDGRIIWATLTVSLVRDPQGSPRYFIAIVDDISETVQAFRELYERAVHDPLTGLNNRATLDETCAAELHRARRYQRPLSIIMIDVDHFKRINDEHGHTVGDEVLRRIASTIAQTLRRSDWAFRYGGEELLLILPEVDHDAAMVTGGRLRERVESCRFEVAEGAVFQATISLGVATYPADGEHQDELIQRADQALYAAKATGRNRCVSSRLAAPELQADRQSAEALVRNLAEAHPAS